MPVNGQGQIIAPFGDEAMRLLREKWANPTMLAEELFPILQTGIPQQSGPITINISGTEDFVTFKNATGIVGTIDYQGRSRTTSSAPARVRPTIDWDNPADIASGVALGGTQLNAVATDPANDLPLDGSYTYDPPSGTVLADGDDQPLTVVFTPTNSTSYLRSRKTVFITVGGSPPLANFVFVQSNNTHDLASSILTRTMSFTADVQAGSLLIVIGSSNLGVIGTVTDNQGNTWSSMGGTLNRYTFASASGPLTVQFTPISPGWVSWAILEYLCPVTAAFNDRETNSVDGTASVDVTTLDPILISGTDCLCFSWCSWTGTDISATFTEQVGYSLRVNDGLQTVGQGDASLFYWDNVAVNSSIPMTGTLSNLVGGSIRVEGYSFRRS